MQGRTVIVSVCHALQQALTLTVHPSFHPKMVTHAVALCLPGASFVVALDNGRVRAAGSPADVRASGALDDEISNDGEGVTEEDEKEQTIEELDEGVRAKERAEIKKKQAMKKAHVNEETYAKGSVGFGSYKLYLRSFAKSLTG